MTTRQASGAAQVESEPVSMRDGVRSATPTRPPLTNPWLWTVMTVVMFVGVVVSATYALLGLGTLMIALPQIRRTGALPTFLAAVTLLATSVLIDLVDPREWWGPNGVFAVEDGAKFIGIGLWTDAVLRMSRRLTVARVLPKDDA